MQSNHFTTQEKFIDPICGMTVVPEKSAGEINYDGKTFYFCSKGCLEKFKKQIETKERHSPMIQLGRKKISDADFKTHVDPVCKMLVKSETAATSFDYKGKTYYFCAVGCLNKFRQTPEKFLSADSEPAPCLKQSALNTLVR